MSCRDGCGRDAPALSKSTRVHVIRHVWVPSAFRPPIQSDIPNLDWQGSDITHLKPEQAGHPKRRLQCERCFPHCTPTACQVTPLASKARTKTETATLGQFE
jgi:hypothetical protein